MPLNPFILDSSRVFNPAPLAPSTVSTQHPLWPFVVALCGAPLWWLFVVPLCGGPLWPFVALCAWAPLVGCTVLHLMNLLKNVCTVLARRR